MRTEDALRAASARIGLTVDGKYKLSAVIGLGGMGVVYAAEHLYLGRPVALKVLHPRLEDGHEASLRFLREARTCGLVQHRAIVEVMDAGFVDGTTPYIVMERLRGESLRDRITRRKALRVAQAIVVLREVLKGLVAAHARGVIHCDLKPENVFLVERHVDIGSIKILDFGIARLMSEGIALGDPNGRAGTPNYMAPEQVDGLAIDGRVDLYALGLLLHESLSGKPAFPLEPRATVFDRVRRLSPPRLEGLRGPIPAELSGIVTRLMAKDRNARHATAADAIEHMVQMGLERADNLTQPIRGRGR